jgi:hypothetical protein
MIDLKKINNLINSFVKELVKKVKFTQFTINNLSHVNLSFTSLRGA